MFGDQRQGNSSYYRFRSQSSAFIEVSAALIVTLRVEFAVCAPPLQKSESFTAVEILRDARNHNERSELDVLQINAVQPILNLGFRVMEMLQLRQRALVVPHASRTCALLQRFNAKLLRHCLVQHLDWYNERRFEIGNRDGESLGELFGLVDHHPIAQRTERRRRVDVDFVRQSQVLQIHQRQRHVRLLEQLRDACAMIDGHAADAVVNALDVEGYGVGCVVDLARRSGLRERINSDSVLAQPCVVVGDGAQLGR